MSSRALKSINQINGFLRNNEHDFVIFKEICKKVGELIKSSVVVSSYKGKVLGIYENSDFEELNGIFSNDLKKDIDEEINEGFLEHISTVPNIDLPSLGFEDEMCEGYYAILIPMYYAGERLGTTFIYRKKSANHNSDKKSEKKNDARYDDDDIIVSSYASTVVTLEMMRAIHEESNEEVRKEASAKSAMEALSPMERKAIIAIFKYYLKKKAKLAKKAEKSMGDGSADNTDINNQPGIIVNISEISTKSKIKRTNFVNAIKKMKSAGIIESNSSGMSGTYIEVINEAIFGEIS